MHCELADVLGVPLSREFLMQRLVHVLLSWVGEVCLGPAFRESFIV
jgi:hypothetical protein